LSPSPQKNRSSAAAYLFRRRLLRWYRARRRALPWRATRDPYRIWVSEVMLQQTTVQAVIPYYERWLRLFPDVKALARASRQEVLRAWQGLGYYARARNLHDAARAIVRDFGGRLPDDLNALRSLPGFGPYTAAAVASIAFGRPCPILDANVRRLVMRLENLSAADSRRTERRALRFLEARLPRRGAGDFNQALMEVGALVCKPRNPLCLLCPLRPACRAEKAGRQELIPPPRKKAVKKVEAVVAIIRKKGRLLIQKRPAHGLLADLWEFPGGKRRPEETLEQALRREIREELGVEVVSARPLTSVTHAYTRFLVRLHAFAVTTDGEPALSPVRRRWITLRGMQSYPLPSGTVRLVEFLERSGRGRARGPGPSTPWT
jgi:A/G-specific adenine glycosylase